VNTIEDLRRLKAGWGAEIDLRSDVNRRELHLSHDPFTRGTSFSDWLDEFAQLPERGPLILNTKEDGLEESILERLKAAGIRDYFFLDTAFPTLVRYIQKGNPHFALRLSRYEPSAGFAPLAGRVEWIWVDCFGREPLPPDELEELKTSFRICLVSPELQGGATADFPRFKQLALLADAICTKDPIAWVSELGEGK
jgi:hypothetical protein